MRIGDLDEALRMIENSKADNPFINGKNALIWKMAHDSAISCVTACSTIDAVPVVRCKDCKNRAEYFNSGRYICIRTQCTICGGVTYIHDNDFCSYGEPKMET